MNKNYTWVIIILLVILGIIFFAGNNTDGTTGTNATSTQGTNNATSTGTPITIEEYVRMNISALSPIKEQVGGTFFVTDIDIGNGTGTVEYEDGHNAYTADFTYDTDANGSVFVRTFRVRE
jgi:hypothetical protein